MAMDVSSNAVCQSNGEQVMLGEYKNITTKPVINQCIHVKELHGEIKKELC